MNHFASGKVTQAVKPLYHLPMTSTYYINKTKAIEVSQKALRRVLKHMKEGAVVR